MIVESPAKAKTINKYLGDDFVVLASFGHVVDLPSKTGSVLPDEDFKMIYEVSARSQKHLDSIFKIAKNTTEVFIATDPDREGEAIAWHLADLLQQNIINPKYTQIKRVTFNEITKSSVQAGIKNAREIDDNLVNAQKARRALDYLVGFTLSPVLWKKLSGCRSAGRVQSVALRLISEREFEVAKFKKEEYWDLGALFQHNKKSKFFAKLVKINNTKLNKFDLPNENLASKVKLELEMSEFSIKEIIKKQSQKNPVAPLITSTLQQEASRKINFNTKKTMQVAQKLYEGVNIKGKESGLITYMRTDGVYMSKESINEVRNYIKKEIGEEYLHKTVREYASKIKNAQEAHEAIRPVDINLTPSYLKEFLTVDEYKLYDLIWKKTVASQMSSVIFDTTNIIIKGINSKDNKEFELKAVGSTITFDGFYKIYKNNSEDQQEEQEDNASEESATQNLPILTEKDAIEVAKIESKQHFTEPPPRFTEASLVKELEELGIGRPSTYASIISVLQDRGYVNLEKKRFIPESKGSILSIFLTNFFTLYVEYSFTANLENELDLISEGKLDYKSFLRKFWVSFIAKINEVLNLKTTDVINILDTMLESILFPTANSRQCNMCLERINEAKNNTLKDSEALKAKSLTSENSVTLDIKEEIDNMQIGTLSLKLGRFGAFIACSNYPICKYTKQILNNIIDTNEQNTSDNLSPTKSNLENQVLGIIDGEELLLKNGRFGRYVELKTKDGLRRTSISAKTQQEISFEYAKELISFPKNLGKVTLDKKEEEALICIGRYGKYIKVGKKNIKIPKNLTAEQITLEDVQSLV